VLARNLINILDAYGLRNKIIAYVKDKGSNLNSLANPLKSVVKCDTLGLEKKISRNLFWSCFLQSMPICHN